MARRNNEDRLGGAAPEAQAPPIAAMAGAENPFNFTTPTEFVELPSKGRFYPEGHPLHGQDTVEIRFMTAKDEDILSSRALLKKGVAIDRMLSNIIVGNIPVESLLVGDKNAIIIAARTTGFGSEYTTNITCPSCLEPSEHEFDLTEVKVSSGDPESVGAEETEGGTFKVVLPRTMVEVEFKLLTGADERKLYLTNQKKKKHKLEETPIVDTMRLFIVSVAGQNDPGTIGQFLEVLPASDSRALRTAFTTVTPNVDMKQMFVCEDCSHEQEMEVPLTADFFWPDR